MLADLDHFKKVNDHYGHACGDAILKETAKRLRDNLRAVDLLARIGGEEFLIVLPDVTQQHADETAARLCELMRATPFACQYKNVSVTMSIGVTLGGKGTPNKSVETLLEEADSALYGAKRHGRDQVLFSVAVA
jgi:two-component system cell cycle response regulator